MVTHLLSGLVLVASGGYFIWLTVFVFAKPVVAERFFRNFASSARTHFVEQVLRALFGGSLVIYSAAMWQAAIFRAIGWVVLVSSVGLVLIPWQWHHRFAKRVLPIFIRYMRLYAISAFVFGIIILYAIIAPQLKRAVF